MSLSSTRPGQETSHLLHFKSIEEAAEWFDTHDTAEYEDEFEDVKEPVEFAVRRARASKAITIRLDEETLASLTDQAAEQGIGPSTLVRMWILDRLKAQGKQSLAAGR